MTINLYKISDEPNKINKTLGTALARTGNLRSDSADYFNPVIEFYYTATSEFDYNYAYIQFGGASENIKRYYFLVNKEFTTTGLMRCTFKLDVLYTYRTQIMSTPMLIERSEVNPSPYITDHNRPSYNYPMVLTKKFPDGFDEFTFFLTTSA